MLIVCVRARIQDSKSLLVGVRDDNCLHCVDMNTFEQRPINMNANKDDHVSFTALQLTCTADGNYVLISTGIYCICFAHVNTLSLVLCSYMIWCADHDRLLLLHLASSQHVCACCSLLFFKFQINYFHQVRAFYGATNNVMSQPRHCFDISEKYVYSVLCSPAAYCLFLKTDTFFNFQRLRKITKL